MDRASPIRIEDVATGLTAVEAVNDRIRTLTTELGLLRHYRTKLQRAERGVQLASIRRDYEGGMSRPAICRKYQITLGQLVGCANRGGWKCDLRKAGRKASVADEQLPAMKAAYEADPAMLKVIAGRCGIDRATLCRYATRRGWVRLGGLSAPGFATGSVFDRVPA